MRGIMEKCAQLTACMKRALAYILHTVSAPAIIIFHCFILQIQGELGEEPSSGSFGKFFGL